MKRNIVVIDREKCNGCGQCVSACHEGAIQMVNGKAELVSDIYCDGLGACIGHCPVDAITVVEREAAAFDEAAVKARLATQAAPAPKPHGGCPGSMARTLSAPAAAAPLPPLACGCPGSMAKALGGNSTQAPSPQGRIASELRQWPIQLHLVPVNAPYWQDADLLVAADCVAAAYPEFQRDLLKNKKLAIACPKLDDTSSYAEKLAAILATNTIKSVTVVRMEVPCCGGIVRIVQEAIARSGKDLPLTTVVVGLEGNIR